MSRIQIGIAMVVMVLIGGACVDTNTATTTSAQPTTTRASPIVQVDTGPNWELEVEAGDRLSFQDDRFYRATVVASEEAILLVGEKNNRDRLHHLITWFRDSKSEWVEGEITPQGEFTEFEPWIVTAAPNGFLVAGISTKEGNDRRHVTSVIGDGMSWQLAENQETGMPAVVHQIMKRRCLCGFLRSVVQYRDGYLAGGQSFDHDANIWWSTDGAAWTTSTLGHNGTRGVVGVAAVDNTAYAFGSAPNLRVWRSDDGLSWEAIADGPAFGLPRILEYQVEPLGMVVDEDRLLALMSLRLPYRDEKCLPPLEDCDERSLALFSSPNGVDWERLPLPESVRWIDREASIAVYDGRVYIAKTTNDQLELWSTDDPAAVVVPTPEEQHEAAQEPFVAVRTDFDWRDNTLPRIDVQPFARRSDGWEPLHYELSARQGNTTTYIDIGTNYLAKEGALIPQSETAVVALSDEEPHSLTISIDGAPLGPGLHEFNLSIPVWVVEDGGPTGDPTGLYPLTIIVNVFDAARIEAVRPFCDVAVRIVSGEPILENLDVFDEYANTYLEGELKSRALAESVELKRAMTIGGYETSGVVIVTGDACGRYDLDMLAVSH